MSGSQMPKERDTAPAESNKPTVAHMLGEIVWVLAQSPTHKHFSLADLEWLVVPPLMLEQYRVFRDAKNAPIGVALWAYLDEAAEASLEAGNAKLRPDQWKSGDRLWLVELVAAQALENNFLHARMLTDLTQGTLRGAGTIYYHTIDPSSRARIKKSISNA